jgi:hypothetical protein
MAFLEGDELHNYPEGYEKKPWCPHTKLINICASLAGSNIDPESFCYEKIKNPIYSGGAINWIIGGNLFPETSCVNVNWALVKQIKIAEMEIVLPAEFDVDTRISGAESFKERVEIVNTYTKTRAVYDERQSILKRWRKVIFETCCSTPSDEKNLYFRQIKSQDELSEEEIIGRVKHFTAALNKITGYNERLVRDKSAENCKQSPHFSQIGEISC